MASLRHRRGIAEAEDYSDGSGTTAAGTDYSATEEYEDENENENENENEGEEEEEEEEEDHRLNLGVHSMTAKGIQHLCSELLEIKKASEQDLGANVYLSYLSFIRMFQEAGGDLDKDVHHLKRQVMAHRRLIQHLTTNCFYSIPPMLLGSSGSNNYSSSIRTMMMEMVDDEKDEEEDLELELELELDVLLSEHRMEQALELLERQSQQAVVGVEATASSSPKAEAEAIRIRALQSARKARVADRLASVAENRRTPRPELLKALSGLCRLGDAERANHLLFKFHSAECHHETSTSRMMRSECESGGGNNNYIKDLALMVLSSIAQASRGFVALHGHPSPYTPQLVRWAREEMEDLGDAFTEFVIRSRSSSSSMSMMPGTGSSSCCLALALALEAAECAVSYAASSSSCSLLRRLDVATEQDVVRLVAPCLREAVAMYGRHLKEVVRLLVASESDAAQQATSTFLTMPPPPQKLELELVVVEQQYCLLTSSGRKFVTLIQEVLEDVAWPLLNLGRLGMVNDDDDDSSSSVALQLVAELFREYMRSIVELITIIIPGGNKEENVHVGFREEEQYMWQISILINCTTLVSLFPIIARGISNSKASSSESDAAAQAQHRQQAVDSLVSLIKEAAGQVWSCFCQHFIRHTIVPLSSSSSAAAAANVVHHTRRQPQPQPQGLDGHHMMMPSLAFQTVFLRVRRLTKHAAGTGTRSIVKKLLQELMEAIVSWLSSNLDSWVHQHQHQQQQQLQLQLQLDVHFLLEFAQLGGFSSDKMRSSALELLRRAAQEMEISQQQVVVDDDEGFGWAPDAAKQAVQALLTMQGSDSDGTPPSNDEQSESGQHHAATSASEEDDDEDVSGGGAAKSSDELFISIEEEEEEEDDAKAVAAADTS